MQVRGRVFSAVALNILFLPKVSMETRLQQQLKVLMELLPGIATSTLAIVDMQSCKSPIWLFQYPFMFHVDSCWPGPTKRASNGEYRTTVHAALVVMTALRQTCQRMRRVSTSYSSYFILYSSTGGLLHLHQRQVRPGNRLKALSQDHLLWGLASTLRVRLLLLQLEGGRHSQSLRQDVGRLGAGDVDLAAEWRLLNWGVAPGPGLKRKNRE